jgi:CheY-like chemotaxis protein
MKAILFVDDNRLLSQLSCEILDMEGYRAVPAYDAAEALKLLESEDFDILITDFRMEGMNGLELARAVHAKIPTIPIMIVTAYGPIEAGPEVNVCLDKEELFPRLLDKIRLLLGEPEPQADSSEMQEDVART